MGFRGMRFEVLREILGVRWRRLQEGGENWDGLKGMRFVVLRLILGVRWNI